MKLACLLLPLLVVPVNAQELDKSRIDKTGINWVLPFKDAMARAKKENRIIAMKMIAGGSSKAGCW